MEEQSICSQTERVTNVSPCDQINMPLQSKYVKRVHVNSKFQLDVGSVTLNFNRKLEIPIFKGKFSQIFKILIRPISQKKAPMTFPMSHS